MERKACIARSYLEKVLVDEATEPKGLPLSLLEDVTNDFSHDQEIGSGGFAVVYKGILGDKEIAVKKLFNFLMKDTEFDREIECLMRVKHRNVVRFLGYCDDTQRSREKFYGKPVMAETRQRLLCFEYIPNGSLDEYIKDAYRQWGTCYKIIKDICEGVQYLHDNNIIHLDLKPANILLDNNMVPKITDFGLSRCFEENQSRHITKTISGTLGYLAPEWSERGEITRSADLYSLGVILMEILTGQRGHQNSTDVLKIWSERSQGTQLKEIQVCYEIALECNDLNPEKRPASARDIIDRLHEMGSIQTAEAASSTLGVAPTQSKGKSKDEPRPHPLEGHTVVMPSPTGPASASSARPYHGPRDDWQETSDAAPSDPVASTSRAPAAESKGKSKDEPRVFNSVFASAEPRHATLHAMPAWPEKTVVMPRPPGPAQAAAPSSQYGLTVTETKPPLLARLGRRGAGMAATRMESTYDMVEPMSYLYVSVVKARDLPTMDIIGALALYVEVKLGHFKGVTQHLEKNHNPVWRKTFAFFDAHRRASKLVVIVKDKDTLGHDFVGRVVFYMSDIPSRVPPDSPLVPQWYTLSDFDGERFWHGHPLGEIMLAVWFGTQADEAFPEAWHSDAHLLSEEELTNTRSTVYDSPKLMYLKVAVIAVIAVEKGRSIQPVIAAMQLGNQIRRTRPGQPRGWANQTWNEEFMFVASEPSEDPLVVTVEEEVAAEDFMFIGRIIIPVADYMPRNDLAKPVPPKWFELHVHDALVCKIRLKMSLETSYHVLESTDNSSDLQPAANKLRKSAIGVLKVGILSARGLGGNKNPYCVAKYGAKWVRTRTLLGAVASAWNEQYTWEVFDLSTALVVAVFDNNHLHHGEGGNDQRIGKVRLRLTTLESDRVYSYHYPLMALSPGGLKKTGELHLAVRFTCTAWANMLAQYGRPLLPKMHYTNPISVLQLDYLRFQAMQMVATRLGRFEPPLHREVVEYMLDVNSHMFSLRKSKANFHRITKLFSGVVAVAKWFDGICMWKNPLTTILVHVVFLKLVCNPELILPIMFLCLIMIAAWNYCWRPRHPPHIDTVLSHTELAHPDELDEELNTFPNIDAVMWWYREQMYPDELDEEFDTFPTSQPDDIVRRRYDRLRGIAGTVQMVSGYLATHGERVHSLLLLLDPRATTHGERWHDPRLTAVFITLLPVLAAVLYLTPFRVVAMVMVLYFLRPPWLRGRGRTNLLLNLYSRLPSKDDVML